MNESPILIRGLNHYFGEGDLRRQILYDIDAEIRSGEIVILTGPSGSGKTTLLTLMGALRSAQVGSLRVLGRDLLGANEKTLTEVRRGIGYIFQAHNLLDALTARQNVQMSLQLHEGVSSHETERRVVEALGSVGLAGLIDRYPHQLSGGQQQRIAVARALVARPRIVLADEPTASLDRETGRAVVELIRDLARRDGVTAVLVTHDTRVLDVADRVLVLEDGRVSSLMSGITISTERTAATLAREIRGGDVARRITDVGPDDFVRLLQQVTEETQRFLDVINAAQGTAFEGMVEQVLAAVSSKIAQILGASGAAIFLLDQEGHSLWSFAKCEHGEPREIRVALGKGSTGNVGLTGASMSVGGASGERISASDLSASGEHAGASILSVAIADSLGRVFAVAEVTREHGKPSFVPEDEAKLRRITGSLGVVLEAWWRMGCTCRSAALGATPVCCRSSAVSPSGGMS